MELKQYSCVQSAWYRILAMAKKGVELKNYCVDLCRKLFMAFAKKGRSSPGDEAKVQWRQPQLRHKFFDQNYEGLSDKFDANLGFRNIPFTCIVY